MSLGKYGALPAGWVTSPLKHVVNVNSEVLPESTDPEEVLQYVDIAALEGGTCDLSPKEVKFSEAPSRARRVLRSGDTIVSTVRTYLKAIATFPQVEGNLIASTGFAVLRPNGKLHSRYAYWATLADPFIENVVANSTGVSYPAIAPTTLGNLPIVVPPWLGQEHIANFLDDKTARIDALIAEKERLGLSVREYFTARLGTAVVQGIRAGRKLVDAHSKGFETIPEDWSLTPIKHLASASGGMTPSKDNDDFWQGDIPWVSPKDMKRFVLHDSADHISQLALDSTSLKQQPIDSVLVVVRGMILAHTFPVALNAVPVTINQDMKALRVKGRVSARYLAWMLRGLQPLMLALTEESAHGTKALRTDQWANQCVPVPPAPEQIELVQAFERWEGESEKLRSHLEQHIARLREYRSSLISAAVTGQLDVGAFGVPA